jgi:hypothetical protein
MRRAGSRTVLTSEPPPRVSARWCGELLGQRRVADLPCGSSCVTTRDASDRLLPSHVLRTSTRASSVPDASCACAPARSRRSPASHQCDSLRWATRLSWCHRGGRCLPVAMRAVRTSGIPVASSTGGLSLARPAHPWKPPRPPSTRSRERCGPYEQSEMPSIERDPLPRNALSGARLRAFPGSRLGHRNPGSRRLFTPASPCEPSGARLPSTRPVANGRHASLSLGVACRFLQPETTREHTQRASDPRTRVELSPRYSPAPTDAGCVAPRYVAASGSCEPRPAPTGLRTTGSTFVDQGKSRAEAFEKRRAARSWTMSRVPFSWRLGHPGRRLEG